MLNAETVARCASLWLNADAPVPPTRLVAMSGAVAQRGVLETELTATLSELVSWSGGATTPLRAVLLGGYGGSWVDWSTAANLPLARLTQADPGVTLGAGLVHLQGAGCPLAFVASVIQLLAAESAGQCGPCMFGLPAIAADVHELSDPTRGPAAWQRLRRHLPMIEGRGACRHPDGAVRHVVTALQVFAPHIHDHWSGHCDAASPTTLDGPGLARQSAA